jgi:hypothetical protein
MFDEDHDFSISDFVAEDKKEIKLDDVDLTLDYIFIDEYNDVPHTERDEYRRKFSYSYFTFNEVKPLNDVFMPNIGLSDEHDFYSNPSEYLDNFDGNNCHCCGKTVFYNDNSFLCEACDEELSEKYDSYKL